MNLQHTVINLGRLVDLRNREVESLTAELARQHAVAERYRRNLQRMRQMLIEVGRSSAGCPILASNSAHYKASLVDMIAAHLRDLASQETVIEAARVALERATLRRERVDRALQGKQRALRHEREVRDQKRQDQLALQSWVHARHFAKAS